MADLAGIAVPFAEIKIKEWGIRKSGPLLIAHWGFSGPATLKASAFGARWMHEKDYRFPLAIQWIGGRDPDQLREELDGAGRDLRGVALGFHSQWQIPRRLWIRLLERAGQDPEKRWTDWGTKGRNQFLHRLHHDEYEWVGRTANKEEFVTAGGLDLREIHVQTTESRKWPGRKPPSKYIFFSSLRGSRFTANSYI